jgi:hypothetical protein
MLREEITGLDGIFPFAELETCKKSLVPLEIPTVSKSAIQLFAEPEGIPVPEPD